LLSLVSPDRILSLLRVGPFPDALVALGSLVGGIALTADRWWGWWVVAVASGLGFAIALRALVLPDAVVPGYGPPPGVWAVVHGLIGGAALHARGRRAALGQWRALGRVSYAFLGAVALWVSYVLSLFFRTSSADPAASAAGLGFFVAIPFGIAAAIALVVAGIQTLWWWRDLRLVILLALTIGFAVYLGTWWNYEWVPWSVYGLASLALALTPGGAFERAVAA
jgi:hypothetical protein